MSANLVHTSRSILSPSSSFDLSNFIRVGIELRFKISIRFPRCLSSSLIMETSAEDDERFQRNFLCLLSLCLRPKLVDRPPLSLSPLRSSSSSPRQMFINRRLGPLNYFFRSFAKKVRTCADPFTLVYCPIRKALEAHTATHRDIVIISPPMSKVILEP
jgi:hypothetical protein